MLREHLNTFLAEHEARERSSDDWIGFGLASADARRAFVERAAESLDGKTCIALLGAASDRELRRALFEEWSGRTLTTEHARTQWCFEHWRMSRR